MPRPLFTIVTPSFNQAAYLGQTIASVLNQRGHGTDFDIEYFVIDGGSDDGSVDVIRQYESDLAGWCSEPDRGQTDAINKGFAKARGDLRGYINSDDYYEDDALAHVVARRDGEPFDLVHGICRHVDGDGRPLREQCGSITSLTEMLDLWRYWLKPFDNRNFVQPEVFWTAQLADRLGGFDPTRDYAMDFDFFLRGFDAAMRVAAIDRVLANFRIHAQQKTSQQDRTRLELIDIVEPYLHRQDDPRIDRPTRTRLLRRHRLERRMIQMRQQPGRSVLGELSRIARQDPAMLSTAAFWKHTRKAGKRLWTG